MEYPKPAAVIPEDDDLDLDVSCRSNNVDNFEAGYTRTSNDPATWILLSSMIVIARPLL
jgi:hypothetical protein